jgi:hypothetical protein
MNWTCPILLRVKNMNMEYILEYVGALSALCLDCDRRHTFNLL